MAHLNEKLMLDRYAPKQTPPKTCRDRAVYTYAKETKLWGARHRQATAACPALSAPDSDVTLIITNASLTRECETCRRAFATIFRMPELWWSDFCRKSSGHFGCEAVIDNGQHYTRSWLFSQAKFLDKRAAHRWYMMNIYVLWHAEEQRTVILLFDPPRELQQRIVTPMLEAVDPGHFSDPFWVQPYLMEEMVRAQDEAVWSMRTHIRNIEKSRMPEGPPAIDFSARHDLARHAIHISETLDVTIDVMNKMQRQHATYMGDTATAHGHDESLVFEAIRDRLSFFGVMFEGLRARSQSNRERLQNEIQLSFNLVSQHDAGVSLRIGQATQSDSAAMRTIAFMTLVFLPATFISAVFSTSFFSYDEGVWRVASEFWLYWVFVIPVTAGTFALWYLWQGTLPKPATRGSGRASDADNL